MTDKYWKDNFPFGSTIEIWVHNFTLFFLMTLLLLAYIKLLRPALFDALNQIIYNSLEQPAIYFAVVLVVGLALMFPVILVFFIHSIQVVSYYLFSKPIIITSNGISIGGDKLLLSSNIEKYLLLKKTRKYPTVNNPATQFLAYNQIKKIEITSETTFKPVLSRRWRTKKETIYFLNVTTLTGELIRKEIFNIFSFKENGCLNFLSDKLGGEIKVPEEFVLDTSRLSKGISIFFGLVYVLLAILFLLLILEQFFDIKILSTFL